MRLLPVSSASHLWSNKRRWIVRLRQLQTHTVLWLSSCAALKKRACVHVANTIRRWLRSAGAFQLPLIATPLQLNPTPPISLAAQYSFSRLHCLMWKYLGNKSAIICYSSHTIVRRGYRLAIVWQCHDFTICLLTLTCWTCNSRGLQFPWEVVSNLVCSAKR